MPKKGPPKKKQRKADSGGLNTAGLLGSFGLSKYAQKKQGGAAEGGWPADSRQLPSRK